jgi:hypothetical protein
MDLPAKGGFSFDLCRRNSMLEKNGLKLPGFRKTGTTIVGLVFQVRPPTLVASPFRYPVITMYVFCWSSGTRFCEFGRLELCAAVCSCFLGLQTAF